MITKIQYNWHQVGDNEGMGEDYEVESVGGICRHNKIEVKEIKEHRAAGEGDKWFYDVIFIDETEMRLFNPNLVFRTKT